MASQEKDDVLKKGPIGMLVIDRGTPYQQLSFGSRGVQTIE